MSTTNHCTTTITCDSPRCAARHEGAGPIVLTITEDPDTTPDAFARFIKTQFSPFEEKAVEFCGRQCLRDYLDYVYVEPQSPREKAARLARNNAADAAIMSRFEHEPVSQADGVAA